MHKQESACTRRPFRNRTKPGFAVRNPIRIRTWPGETNPNPNLARRNQSESEPSPARPIRIRTSEGQKRSESELRKINPNPGLATRLHRTSFQRYANKQGCRKKIIYCSYTQEYRVRLTPLQVGPTRTVTYTKQVMATTTGFQMQIEAHAAHQKQDANMQRRQGYTMQYRNR